MIHFTGQFDRYPNRQLVAPVLHFQTRSKETPREMRAKGNNTAIFSICFMICDCRTSDALDVGSQFQCFDGKTITAIKNDHEAVQQVCMREWDGDEEKQINSECIVRIRWTESPKYLYGI